MALNPFPLQMVCGAKSLIDAATLVGEFHVLMQLGMALDNFRGILRVVVNRGGFVSTARGFLV